MHLRCREGESPSQCASRGAGLWVRVFAGQIVPVCPRLASFWLRKSQVPGNPRTGPRDSRSCCLGESGSRGFCSPWSRSPGVSSLLWL